MTSTDIPAASDTPSSVEIEDKVPTADLGPLLEGTVKAVSKDSVDLLLDDGRPAVISRENFGLHNESPKDVVSVGDKAFGIELHREDPKSRVVISRVWALKQQAWKKILMASEAKEVVRGKVIKIKKQGLLVDIGLPGFLPSSHLSLDDSTDLEQYRDQIIDVKILEASPKKEKLMLTRRPILLKEQRKEVQNFLASLKVGQKYTGVVDTITDYGVFIDLGYDIKGLAHVSELSWEHIQHPKTFFSVGEQVTAKVLEVKVGKRRVSLSVKQAIPDPINQIEVGSIHSGEVLRLADFGVFVKVGVLEGLVHLSELSEYRVTHPSELFAPGDQVSTKVVSVDKSRRRLNLSIKQAIEFQG